MKFTPELYWKLFPEVHIHARVQKFCHCCDFDIWRNRWHSQGKAISALQILTMWWFNLHLYTIRSLLRCQFEYSPNFDIFLLHVLTKERIHICVVDFCIQRESSINPQDKMQKKTIRFAFCNQSDPFLETLWWRGLFSPFLQFPPTVAASWRFLLPPHKCTIICTIRLQLLPARAATIMCTIKYITNQDQVLSVFAATSQVHKKLMKSDFPSD